MCRVVVNSNIRERGGKNRISRSLNWPISKRRKANRPRNPTIKYHSTSFNEPTYRIANTGTRSECLCYIEAASRSNHSQKFRLWQRLTSLQFYVHKAQSRMYHPATGLKKVSTLQRAALWQKLSNTLTSLLIWSMPFEMRIPNPSQALSYWISVVAVAEWFLNRRTSLKESCVLLQKYLRSISHVISLSVSLNYPWTFMMLTALNSRWVCPHCTRSVRLYRCDSLCLNSRQSHRDGSIWQRTWAGGNGWKGYWISPFAQC